MFKHPDLDKYLLFFLDRASIRQLLQVNHHWYGIILNSPFLKYLNMSSEILSISIMKTKTISLLQWLVEVERDRNFIILVSIASRQNNVPMIKYLYPHIDNSLREFAIREGSEYGSLHVIQFLVNRGVNYHGINDYAFRWACDGGYLEVAKYLYSQGDIDYHTDNDFCFIWACKSGRMDIIHWLWTLGIQNPASLKSAYRLAEMEGRSEVIQLFLQKQLNVL